ncbi:hypothetical protein LCGC14_1869260, partial [marine sediment metagenome]
MSINEQKTNDDQNTDQQSQSTDSRTESNTVPSYRLKEEADKRRTAETELAEFKKEKQEREEAELSDNEKLKKQLADVTGKFDTFKATTAQKDLGNHFTQKAVEAGLPTKIAKVAI